MIKKLIAIFAAVIMISSFTGCSTYQRSEKRQVELNSSQSVTDGKGQDTKVNDKVNSSSSSNDKNVNQEKTAGNIDNSNTGANSTETIDQLIKTIKDMGGTADSLEYVNDEDLKVPDPQ